MKKGQINVKTENIFPIIKKFLYSEHEIFLRELVSNAVDATQKLKTLSRLGEFNGELGDLTIRIILDEEKKTLTIKDRGIGMSGEEVGKYINQIAFSGAEEFVEKFKEKSQSEVENMIGHFGLGFYSSFMVSDKAIIQTKSYRDGENDGPVQWECDGSPNYTLKDLKGEYERGTSIILHISDDSKEFLDEHRILGLLKKYCKFLPVPIQFGAEKTRVKKEGEKDKDGNDVYEEIESPRIINNTTPAWVRKPSELTEEDYMAFYHELYPMSWEEPLFHIHLNVDYPFNLTGILYFPKISDRLGVQKDKIQLYSNQVFVTDSLEGIVPDFLTLLHGVLDSPDIPLNVSRSYLQSDSEVKKINGHITKKVSDKLNEIFKNNREDFEKKWDDIKAFIEYGMISDEKFYDRSKIFALMKNIEGKYFTLEEYQGKVKDIQSDKDKNIVYLYTTNEKEQHAFIETAKERGYDVLVMDGILDQHFLNHLEMKEQLHFKRVDADVIEKLIQKEENIPSKLDDKEKEKLKPIFEKAAEESHLTVMFESLNEKDMPTLITRPEFMRRMKDMQEMSGGGGFGMFPDSMNLVINVNHPLISAILNEKDEEKQNRLAKQTVDLSLLSQGLLKGEALTTFIKRSVDLID
ncbi:MAG: molecular chaperone HtpG [Bacteroidales bacterium]|jgi:molecular chaperone HtpG|nr:molecular chaperone HtpG [Bacteroidales bacterium]